MGKKYRNRRPGHKVDNEELELEELERRARNAKRQGNPVPKYLQFAYKMICEGYDVYLYEASFTVSKYLTVKKDGYKPFKVRFSNHKPIEARELKGDCDFFVGHTNLAITTTGMAIQAVFKHFGDANARLKTKQEATGSPQEELEHTST